MTAAIANDNHLAPFTASRARLRALAYRLLGSLSEADDVVQDAWLRWSAIDALSVRLPEAFLTTLVTRLALDRMRAARRMREAYTGQWLPEPAVLAAEELHDAGEVSLAFLHLLERLTPEQRAVYVLREAMDLDYAEIAQVVGKTIAGCRQMMRRAREAVAGPARFATTAADLAAMTASPASSSASSARWPGRGAWRAPWSMVRPASSPGSAANCTPPSPSRAARMGCAGSS